MCVEGFEKSAPLFFEFWKLKPKSYIHGISLKRKNKTMYTVNEIDRMSVEELEGLTCYLNEEQKTKWSSMGYDGKTFVKLTKE